MNPIYLIQSTQKGSKYKYVVTEQEAKKYIQEQAETIRVRLSANVLQKVYTTSDSNCDIKVVVQQVGAVWNGFLEEYVSFRYFPVDHVLTEMAEEEKFESDDDSDDSDFSYKK